MALNNFKCNHLMPLHFEWLNSIFIPISFDVVNNMHCLCLHWDKSKSSHHVSAGEMKHCWLRK